MHVYLIISRDNKEAYVFSNLKKAKEKCEDIDGIAYEWIQLWCRPIIYDSKVESEDVVFDDSALPWEMLKLAHEQGNWNTRAKYRDDAFNIEINHRR
ncbi:hypothetical protein GKG47_09370 [Lactonifactor sp. BIOML-A3]|uniref:hypothetical protein n=1 Tax=unclassified Lactonifactor TaxID=2636670 RepID=UPI0012B03AF4|nr:MULTISPECIES: hypothetical protein [unclassified Lactonifactor]MSA02247.1 hypothetical protein [Lactonifactor sp. BIOML-A5]MSA08031.1 hypothetical protein [Lactonifactor sp. BIOML-A4]MSA12647.1 hypothetical protein [Lactonifactor sp. BIOML-A3]MSA16651.1 hypothetical protein [Lactonifactor sp. BIOML-A2]MSA37650.1 hypothetical protein [Lactonifactor sp. BIOML-A1]